MSVTLKAPSGCGQAMTSSGVYRVASDGTVSVPGSDVPALLGAGYSFIDPDAATKGQANGIASLGSGGTVPLAQLPAIKTAVVAGTTAVTNIAIAGIKAADRIFTSVNLTDGAVTSEMPAVTSTGNIQFPTLDTTDKKLLVQYLVA